MATRKLIRRSDSGKPLKPDVSPHMRQTLDAATKGGAAKRGPKKGSKK